MAERAPRLLGWREWVGLPGLRVPAIKAKVDTGARTSTLHAIDVTPVSEGGRKRLRFRVLPQQERRDIAVACVADLLEQRHVSSSSGQRELRWVIRTPIRIDGTEWPIELTLTDRGTMQFRMLLGRTALAGRFVVDPTRSFLLGPPR